MIGLFRPCRSGHLCLKKMQHHFQISAIDPAETSRLFDLDDHELAAINACRMQVDKKPGFPCRVSLQDAEVGEEVILMNYLHHDVQTPYRAAGPVFVRKNAPAAGLAVDELPGHLGHRLLSLRGFDHDAMLVAALTIKGDQLENELQNLLGNAAVQYVHIHNSSQGCYHCRVDRR